jgi:hypothetical protein
MGTLNERQLCACGRGPVMTGKGCYACYYNYAPHEPLPAWLLVAIVQDSGQPVPPGLLRQAAAAPGPVLPAPERPAEPPGDGPGPEARCRTCGGAAAYRALCGMCEGREREARRDEWARRGARRYWDDAEAAAARGDRPKRTGRQYARVPQPAAIMAGVLAAEVNLLGGPEGEGKSLLARDWVLAVAAGLAWRGHAAEKRACLYVASEGTHDYAARWQTHPLYENAADNFYVLDEPVSLISAHDVAWLLAEYAAERPGLVVFDVVYGMGMSDDNGVKDALPVIAAMKRISAEWGAATLALGHPPHSGERRLRGSSMWRQLAAVDWHMADGRLSCEKSKIADKRGLGGGYVADYPALRWLGAAEVLGAEAERYGIVQRDIAARPGDTERQRAARLAPVMGVGMSRARQVIRGYLASQGGPGEAL